MSVRPRLFTEDLEDRTLSRHATRSSRSLGRQVAEEPCPIRTAFQRDRDRIIHSKAFRRLKDKTQVFIAVAGDHYRTRLTHTLEVAQIARTMARALRLNEDLTEAIALGHDLGHTPFGHTGEAVLNDALEAEGHSGFRHNEQSLRVVSLLERLEPGHPEGVGLNLTWEVRDGIAKHTGDLWADGDLPATLEGQLVRMSDRIAYINHDIDDAIRGGIIAPEDVPAGPVAVLGATRARRINTLVTAVIEASYDRPELALSRPVRGAMDDLRSFLFERVYVGSGAKAEEDNARKLVQALYGFYRKNPGQIAGGDPPSLAAPDWRRACDYVAGMTDRYAMAQFDKHFPPAPSEGEVQAPERAG
ncbi:MAG TPA: deoxyguanosinetriphosphate triphosphohydrolase [Bacillota bacterium]